MPAPNPWIGIGAGVDPVGWARILRRAHDVALRSGRQPKVLRPLVAASWRRASELGLDPGAEAPVVLDDDGAARALARNPISSTLPTVAAMLGEATDGGRSLVALSDADGLLLWVDGPIALLEAAQAPGFLPGHLCSEGAVGTNAIGTALVHDHPVQIFSAEHFSRRLHGLTCAAAPIHDPRSGRTVGVLDISGRFETGHPHSLPLVTALARLIEQHLAEAARRERTRATTEFVDWLHGNRRPRSALLTRSGEVLFASPRGWLGPRLALDAEGHLELPAGAVERPDVVRARDLIVVSAGAAQRARPPRVEIRPRGSRTEVTISGRLLRLSPRHGQIVMLLALHPEGLEGGELGRAVYGPDFNPVTMRAEISRLGRQLGPVLKARPYRLAARIEADRDELRAALGLEPAEG